MQGSADGPDSVDLLVARFRDSIAPDQYDADTFVPWPDLRESLSSSKDSIDRLQGWVDGRRQAVDLAKILREDPAVLALIRLLVVAPGGVGLRDGRELPGDDRVINPVDVAEVACDLGLRELLPKGVDVESLCRIGLVANDSRRRGFRRRENLRHRVDRLLEEAIATVADRTGVALSEIPRSEQPQVTRTRGITVLGSGDKPIAGVVNVFQDSSGGRQQRDLSVTYPRLQDELDSVPLSLFVLADGKGVADAPERILSTLFRSVAGCMTLEQAEAGDLAAGLERAVQHGGARDTTRGSISTLIDVALRSSVHAEASQLPVPEETGRLALSGYAADHPELALSLAVDGSVLEWENSEAVAAAQELIRDFDPEAALRLLCTALGLRDVDPLPSQDEIALVQGRPLVDAVLPEMLVLAATANDWGEPEMRRIARAAREHVSDSTLAILLVPKPPDPDSPAISRSFQRQLATTVVAVDVQHLPEIVGANSPRDALVEQVLRNADLTKANPFTVMGVTPKEMFYGRAPEEAALLATVGTNSAAIIGGRRIGKTSLLQHVTERLTSERWSPYYADLQEAGDWKTFAEHVEQRWEVSLPKRFAPGHVRNLIASLANRSEGPIVLVLDEVDHLLKWDQDHRDRFPPEAFFRACRAISQEGAAQFVFSGERTIASRLWDPKSPHWNFCRPIAIKQLARADADALLADPLASLGVSLEPRDECLDIAWSYTQGHPQIVQFIGDKVVEHLNDRPSAERAHFASENLRSIVEDAEFSQHYVETYWGQATQFERLITALLALGAGTVGQLREMLTDFDLDSTGQQITDAIRMLDLYGVVDGMEEQLIFRAAHMPAAFEVLGGAASVAMDLSHDGEG